MTRIRLLFVLAMSAMAVLWIGCGGNASPKPTTAGPAPTPTTPTPPSTGGGSGGTGSGGSGSSGATVQWLASLSGTYGQGSNGQVTVDTAGNVNVQLTGAAPNTQYPVTFQSLTAGFAEIHLPVGTLTTDASGNANATMKFPKSGNWAGIFALGNNTFWTANSGFQKTLAPLFGVSTVPDMCAVSRAPCSAATQDRGTGTVTTANDSVHIVLNGAVANATYMVHQCIVAGTTCYSAQGSFDTDASGNGTFDKAVSHYDGAAVWWVERLSGPLSGEQVVGTGFVTAFKVP